MTSGISFTANARDQILQRRHIHVPFERKPRRRLASFRDRQVHGFGADEFYIGARRVEVRVVGNYVALLAHHVEQNAFGRASLMGRDHMLIAKDVLDGVAKMVEAPAAGVAFVPQHDRRPLLGRHRARARIGKQVDQHVVGGKEKQVVVRGAQKLFAFFAGRPANRFDALDAKWLDDGFGQHGKSSVRAEYIPCSRISAENAVIEGHIDRLPAAWGRKGWDPRYQTWEPSRSRTAWWASWLASQLSSR